MDAFDACSQGLQKIEMKFEGGDKKLNLLYELRYDMFSLQGESCRGFVHLPVQCNYEHTLKCSLYGRGFLPSLGAGKGSD